MKKHSDIFCKGLNICFFKRHLSICEFVHDYSCIVRWDHGDPVVGVLLFVIMIVAVVVVFISVIFSVHVSLSIKISEHLCVGISISQLWIVMERNCAEWLEIIWVNRQSLWHRFDLLSLSCCSRGSRLGLVRQID